MSDPCCQSIDLKLAERSDVDELQIPNQEEKDLTKDTKWDDAKRVIQTYRLVNNWAPLAIWLPYLTLEALLRNR